MACKQMGHEPDPERIPADFNEFPYLIQEVMQIYNILPGNWEGMSGTYMGKDYTLLPYLINEIYEIEDKKLVMRFLLFIDNIISKQYSEKQKIAQRKNKPKGGTHIKG